MPTVSAAAVHRKDEVAQLAWVVDGRIEEGEWIATLADPSDAHRPHLAGDVPALRHELFARP